MPEQLILIFCVIAAFSVIQSIFGVGLLVFGTPTLLLLGYEFVPALMYLLPASFAVSFLQVFQARRDRTKIPRQLYLLCLPAVGAGLWISGNNFLGDWWQILMGLVLIFSAFTRLLPMLGRGLTLFLKRYFGAYHLAMGFLHGMTNLGGAMLTILVGGLYQDKKEIRNTIAYYYIALSSVQMTVIVTLVGLKEFAGVNLITGIVSSVVYLLIGNRIYGISSNAVYNRALTILMTFYGCAILVMAEV